MTIRFISLFWFCYSKLESYGNHLGNPPPSLKSLLLAFDTSVDGEIRLAIVEL